MTLNIEDEFFILYKIINIMFSSQPQKSTTKTDTMGFEPHSSFPISFITCFWSSKVELTLIKNASSLYVP